MKSLYTPFYLDIQATVPQVISSSSPLPTGPTQPTTPTTPQPTMPTEHDNGYIDIEDLL